MTEITERRPGTNVTFVEYMSEFLHNNKMDTIVEIGSDSQLRIANRLSNSCKRYISLNLPRDVDRLTNSGWYEMGKDLGTLKNCEVIGGDATKLEEVVSHADLIILHNVKIDGNGGEDTMLYWKMRRGEEEATEEKVKKLFSSFDSAKIEAYKQFMKVAKPGFIIVFQDAESDEEFMKFLTETININPGKIKKDHIKYDEEDTDDWVVYTIDNR